MYRICPICGEDFTADHSDEIFCTKSCERIAGFSEDGSDDSDNFDDIPF